MLRLERICRPHRGICRFVVVGGVVTLATYRVFQLYSIRIEFPVVRSRQLKPTFAWLCRCLLWRCQRGASRSYGCAVCRCASRIYRVGCVILQLHIAHLRVGLCCAYIVGCCCRVRGACEVESYKSVSYILRALHHATRRRQSAIERSRYVS